MSSRTRVVEISTALLLGALALAMIPGATTPGSSLSDAPKARIASATSPHPDLLRRLDAEIAPPANAADSFSADDPLPVRVAATDRTTIAPTPAETSTADAASSPPAADVPGRADRIGVSGVNLRNGPSSAAGQLGVLAPGLPVQVGEVVNGWANVTLEDGATGWVYATYLASATPAEPSPARKTAAPRAVVSGAAGDDLEDRTARIGSPLTAVSEPDDSAPSLFKLRPGDRVRIVEVRGAWIRVVTSSGIAGWIRRAG